MIFTVQQKIIKRGELCCTRHMSCQYSSEYFVRNEIRHHVGLNVILSSVGCVSTLYGDSKNFDLCNFPSRGSTYKIGSGGWVVYAEPNFQGKFVVHLPGK